MLKDVFRGNTTTETIQFTLEECCNCGVPFFMPTYLFNRLKRNPGESFYCPNGHGQHYTGKTEAQKLKEQLETEREKAERERVNLQDKWLDALGEKMKLEKQIKRIHKGVCPCCNRSFVNLKRHMETKHPEILKPKP